MTPGRMVGRRYLLEGQAVTVLTRACGKRTSRLDFSGSRSAGRFVGLRRPLPLAQDTHPVKPGRPTSFDPLLVWITDVDR